MTLSARQHRPLKLDQASCGWASAGRPEANRRFDLHRVQKRSAAWQLKVVKNQACLPFRQWEDLLQAQCKASRMSVGLSVDNPLESADSRSAAEPSLIENTSTVRDARWLKVYNSCLQSSALAGRGFAARVDRCRRAFT